MKRILSLIISIACIISNPFGNSVYAYNGLPLIESQLIETISEPEVDPTNFEHILKYEFNPYEVEATEEVQESEPIEEFCISDEDIDLIALVTMAEAEGECEEGKRLVIDTILNRMDSDHFPDTIYDVVYQKNQFTSMWNGRTNRCYVMDDIRQLVIDELRCRTNYDVIFFRTKHYSEYGSPLFRVEHHYFSSY